MKKLLILLLALPLLAACACGVSRNATDAATGAAPVEAQLLGGRFVLQSVNGEATAWERRPEIAFGEGMRMTGQVCNRFIGPGTYKNGVLTAPQMAMTMMLCVDDKLTQLERDFAAMLRNGAKVGLEKDTLTLRGETLTLVYTRSN